MKKSIIFFILFIKIVFLYSQASHISGYIYDKTTGEPIIGAIINLNSKRQTSTNNFGYYSLKTDAKKINLRISYIGYTSIDTSCIINRKNMTLNFYLMFDNNLTKVVVKSHRFIEDVSSGTIELSMPQVKTLPSLVGETDIFKVLQLYPGVGGGVEGMSGFFVRGGSPDQNLILMDDVAVYGSSHIFGFLSIFNEDAIKNVKLIKDGFPAHYSGRLSSVLDVRIKDGNMKKITGNATIGLISSKIMLNGPIIKNKLSFLFSYRRTYFDILKFLYDALQKDSQHSNFHFFDLNTKLSYKVSSKDNLFFSFYTGNDNYFSNDNDTNKIYKTSLSWGNTLSALKWTHSFSNSTFMFMQFSFTNYALRNFYFSKLQDKQTIIIGKNDYSSYIKDITSKIFFNTLISNNYRLIYGASFIKHFYLPGKLYNLTEINSHKSEQTNSTTRFFSYETDFFIENHINIGHRLKLNAGINYSLFKFDSTIYSSPEPRIATSFLVSHNISFKISYSFMNQYLHLLTNSGIGLPSDIWIPATSKLKPEKSQEIAGGVFIEKNKINCSFVGFYKTFNNLTEYKPGTSFFLDSKDWENKVLTNGKGFAYGFEFFLKKNIGKFKTTIAYTLSWNYRQFKELNNNEIFPFKYDRRHDFDISLIYKINDKIKIAAIWTYKTGNALTIPIGVYQSTLFPPQKGVIHLPNVQTITRSTSYTNIMYDDTGILLYSKRNSYRMPAYNRLDISVSFSKKKKKYIRTWQLGLYNAYNHLNPLFLDFNLESVNNMYKASYRIKGLIPILPFVNYSIAF